MFCIFLQLEKVKNARNFDQLVHISMHVCSVIEPASRSSAYFSFSLIVRIFLYLFSLVHRFAFDCCSHVAHANDKLNIIFAHDMVRPFRLQSTKNIIWRENLVYGMILLRTTDVEDFNFNFFHFHCMNTVLKIISIFALH